MTTPRPTGDSPGDAAPPGRAAAGPVAVVAVAVLLGTSIWFSVNAVAAELAVAIGATQADIGRLTGAVQLGFIAGTLSLSLSGLADRFRASRIVALSAVLGAGFNAAVTLDGIGLAGVAALRFLVGVCIAGLYPPGMKLIVSWSPARAGASLSLMIGMLILGTALPHGVRFVGADWSWQPVVLCSSVLALVAAALVLAIGDGPHLPASGPRRARGPAALLGVFRIPRFRASAFGYFGHMWELYAFWTLVPALLLQTALAPSLSVLDVAGLSFLVIAVGAPASFLGGALSGRLGSGRVAAGSLAGSALCCVVFAVAGGDLPAAAAIGLLLAWGATVATDSPHFSALSARACPPDLMGGALAIQNAVGFAVTVAAIWLVAGVSEAMGPAVAWLLLPGPLLGLIGSRLLWARGAPRD